MSKLEQKRCDFCKMEIYLKEEDKVYSDRDYFEIERALYNNDKIVTDKLFCSAGCVGKYLDLIKITAPTNKDRIKALEEELARLNKENKSREIENNEE